MAATQEQTFPFAARPPIHLKYRPDVDGLRALAVLAVIGFHAFPAVVRGGFIGVDIFFVISGYLISGIVFGALENNRFSFAEFYVRRIKRIFPALILILAFCYGLGWFVLFPDEFARLNLHIMGGVGFVSNFVLRLNKDYFHNGEVLPLLHLWSLGIEEQFYFFWPLLLWLTWKRPFAFRMLLLLFGSTSLLLNIFAVGGYVTTFYLPASRFWELLLGSILAYLNLNKIDTLKELSNRMANIASVLGLLMIAAAIGLLDRDQPFPGWRALFPTVGSYLILYAGPAAWFNRVILANRLLVWIGLISYPLYLWHWPLLSFAQIAEGRPPHLAIRIILVLLSFILATLTYTLVEKPIRFGGHVGTTVTTLCLLMAGMGYLGYETYRLHGLAFRGAKSIVRINESQLKWFEPQEKCLHFFGWEEEYAHKQGVFCSLPDDLDTVQVAVIGDSTANALYPGLRDAFHQKQIGVMNLGNSTCFPIRNQYGIPYWSIDCEKINDKIYDFLLKNVRIKTVVMGMGSWGFTDMHMDGVPDHTPIEERFEIFSRMVDRDVKVLTNAGKKVVITYDVPVFPIDPKACIRSSFLSPSACTFSESQVRNEYFPLWQAMLAKRNDVCIFSQSPTLKRNDNFTLIGPGGILMFRDERHLSYFGSDLVGRAFVQSACAQ